MDVIIEVLDMLADDVVNCRALDIFVDRGPSCEHILSRRFNRIAAWQLSQILDALPGLRVCTQAITDPGGAHHVTALLKIRVGIEQVISDVFEDGLEFSAGQGQS